MFLDTFSFRVYKYKRIHIAIDGYNLQEIQKTLKANPNYFRKQKIKHYNRISDDRTDQDKSTHIGSQYSDKYISIYDKQSELKESGKQYIFDFWKRNGLVVENGKNIDRLELRLSRKAVQPFSKELTALNDGKYLAGFIKEHGGGYLEFINKANRKIRNHVINWGILNPITIIKLKTIKHSIEGDPFKPVIKKLYLEYNHTGLECYQTSYNELLRAYNLTSWFLEAF